MSSGTAVHSQQVPLEDDQASRQEGPHSAAVHEAKAGLDGHPQLRVCGHPMSPAVEHHHQDELIHSGVSAARLPQQEALRNIVRVYERKGEAVPGCLEPKPCALQTRKVKRRRV